MQKTKNLNNDQFERHRSYVLLWCSMGVIFIGYVAFYLYSLRYRTAAGLAGVGLLMFLSSLAWKEGRKILFLLLIALAWLLGDVCSVFLVMDAAD